MKLSTSASQIKLCPSLSSQAQLELQDGKIQLDLSPGLQGTDPKGPCLILSLESSSPPVATKSLPSGQTTPTQPATKPGTLVIAIEDDFSKPAS